MHLLNDILLELMRENAPWEARDHSVGILDVALGKLCAYIFSRRLEEAVCMIRKLSLQQRQELVAQLKC